MNNVGSVIVYKDGGPMRKIAIPLKGDCCKVILNNMKSVLMNLLSEDYEFSVCVSKKIFETIFMQKSSYVEELMSMTRYDYINEIKVSTFTDTMEDTIRITMKYKKKK